jgi:transketolase
VEGSRHHRLAECARQIRCLVLRSVYHAGAGHIGGPLSAADILAALYFSVMRIDPEHPDWPDRDRFVLSKGHSSIGLYATLALRGYFPADELSTFDAADSRLQGHPDMTATPGVDMSTGSLGQGLSVGVGMALGARLLGKDFHTWVMIGDGETQEGQIWEAVMVADRYHLGNLTAILDYNQLPQYGRTTQPEGYMGLHRDPPAPDAPGKFAAFGWRVLEVDGHDIHQILESCAAAAQTVHGSEAPTVIIAYTVKGKGVSFMEGDYSWHSRPLSREDLERALAELEVDKEVPPMALGTGGGRA